MKHTVMLHLSVRCFKSILNNSVFIICTLNFYKVPKNQASLITL